MPKDLPPPKYMRQSLDYNPETGDLTWRRRPDAHFKTPKGAAIFNSLFSGKPAISSPLQSGHKSGHITFKGRKIGLLQHRVIWAVYHGKWPNSEVDHIDGDPANNRISNLRLVDRVGNMRNTKRPRDNTSGTVGVYWYKPGRKWRACIQVNRKQISLGYFSDKSDAVRARKSAELKFGFHPNHGR